MATAHLLVDVAGVLVGFDRAPRVARLAALVGVPPAAVEAALYGSGFVDGADAGELDAAGVRAAVRARLADPAGAAVDGAGVDDAALDAGWMSAFVDDALAARVRELLSAVRSERPDVRLVLLSSNDALVAELLPMHLPQVAALADAALLSGVTGLRKPDPRAFAGALELLGAPAQDVLFLDDSAGHVDAARVLGLEAVQVELTAASVAHLADELVARGLLRG